MSKTGMETGTITSTDAYFRCYTALFDAPPFASMRLESKVLYCFFLSRRSLSEKNGLRDKNGRVYIICTVEHAAKFLGCKRSKAILVLNELESNYLIERCHQGRGYPNRIYVNDFQDIQKTNL